MIEDFPYNYMIQIIRISVLMEALYYLKLDFIWMLFNKGVFVRKYNKHSWLRNLFCIIKCQRMKAFLVIGFIKCLVNRVLFDQL